MMETTPARVWGATVIFSLVALLCTLNEPQVESHGLRVSPTKALKSSRASVWVGNRVGSVAVRCRRPGEGNLEKRYLRQDTNRRKFLRNGALAGLAALFAKGATAGELLNFRRNELKTLEAKIQAANMPDDLAKLSGADQTMLAEKFVLETSIDFLEKNGDFCKEELQRIQNGGRFIQHMVLRVPDLEKEVNFWTKGFGLKVVRARTVNGVKTAFVANSPESLKLEDGGSFALELVETGTEVDVGNGLAYIQLRMGDTPRLSEILKAKGKVEFAYGYLQARSPSGYLVQLYVGSARRDPFELIAMRVNDVKASADFYQNAMGMREVEIKEPEKYVDADGPLYGFGGLIKRTFEKVDVLTPRPPKGSVYLTYGKSENDTMGILLLPTKKDIALGGLEIPKGTDIRVGNGFSKLAILTNDIYNERKQIEKFNGKCQATFGLTGPVPGIGTKVAVLRDGDGYSTVFVDVQDFEAEQPPRPKPTSLIADFEKAMDDANSEAKAAEKRERQREEYEALGDAVRGEGFANV